MPSTTVQYIIEKNRGILSRWGQTCRPYTRMTEIRSSHWPHVTGFYHRARSGSLFGSGQMHIEVLNLKWSVRIVFLLLKASIDLYLGNPKPGLEMGKAYYLIYTKLGVASLSLLLRRTLLRSLSMSSSPLNSIFVDLQLQISITCAWQPLINDTPLTLPPNTVPPIPLQMPIWRRNAPHPRSWKRVNINTNVLSHWKNDRGFNVTEESMVKKWRKVLCTRKRHCYSRGLGVAYCYEKPFELRALILSVNYTSRTPLCSWQNIP